MTESPSAWRRPPASRLIALSVGSLVGIVLALVCNEAFLLGSKIDLLLVWFTIGTAPVTFVLWEKLDVDRGRRRAVETVAKAGAFASSAGVAPYGPNSAQVEQMLAGVRVMSPEQVASFSYGLFVAALGDKTILADARRGSVRRSEFLIVSMIEERLDLGLQELWESGSWSDVDRPWIARGAAVIALRPWISTRRFNDFWTLATSSSQRHARGAAFGARG